MTMPVLRKPKHEIVAQALAAGRSPVEASREAGYPDGSSFAPNARKRAQHPRIRQRVTELQERGAALAAIVAGWKEAKKEAGSS
jgi:hypothetical protein